MNGLANGHEKAPITLVSSLARDKNGVYVPSRALELISEVIPILQTFLSGNMKEADEQVKNGDPKGETLYYALGQSLIEGFKAFMSFEDDDLRDAIEITKHSGVISQSHRRSVPSMASRITGFISRSTTGTAWIKGMNDVERHAELAYQEHLLLKAVLGILYSGDWLQFIKEALSLRSANIAFRNMNEFLHQADIAANGHDDSVDQHFRSGVVLGVAMNSLILSLLPNRVLALANLFGYEGDRTESLKSLYAIGGWTKESDDPTIGEKEEGVRRPIADIMLLIFHLLLSSYTHKGVDLSMAQKILDWNMCRYPEGVFYLFAKGRILVCQSRPDLAVNYYEKMMENCQIEFRSLRNISLWELSLCSLALYDMEMGVTKWKKLENDANWSKCVYTYAYAVCSYQRAWDKDLKDTEELMSRVQGLMQRIAGKSIPLEKFAARKAKKFFTQGNRLMLPSLELGYHLLCITRAPRRVLLHKMLPAIQVARAKIFEHVASPMTYHNGKYFWDDYCLAHFLYGVCLRYAFRADAEAIGDPEFQDPPPENAEKDAFDSFQKVIDNGAKIEVDHWIVYYTHYELGRLYACIGNIREARKHLELIHSGKVLVQKSEKGKYSLESNLVMRTHAAIESLGDE